MRACTGWADDFSHAGYTDPVREPVTRTAAAALCQKHPISMIKRGVHCMAAEASMWLLSLSGILAITPICCRQCGWWLFASHQPDWLPHDAMEGNSPRAKPPAVTGRRCGCLDSDRTARLLYPPHHWPDGLMAGVSSAGCEKCDEWGHASEDCVHRLRRGRRAGQAGRGLGRRCICRRADPEHQLWGATSRQ